MNTTLDDRPNPDDLLRSIQQQESREQAASAVQGKFKLFFGMSPGVGKTYAMLQEAHSRLREGVDVVVGYVETHSRTETALLVAGLELLPRKQMTHRGTPVEEFDLDAALARKPALILVDELAHTNTLGDPNPPRHAKRYQDVMELLDAGIDVYSTLNVQHLESRADTVRAITGVTIRETLPDSVLERADEIELVDISPDELLTRLAEGKIYTADTARHAVENFFRKGNLTALREMSLRLTAERVDGQLSEYMSEHRIAGPWKSGDRLLVAVSASPYSEQLVRWTRRMAYTMKASWIALSVETSTPTPEQDQKRLAANLSLAQELGADIHTIADDDVVRGILRAAQQHNVSQIVVGKPLHASKRGLSIVDRLIEQSGTIDLHVVRVEEIEPLAGQFAGQYSPSRRSFRNLARTMFVEAAERTEWRTRWKRYAAATGLSVVTALACLPLLNVLTYQAIGLVMLFSIALASLALTGGAVALMAALNAVLWNFLFIPPRFTFVIGSLEDRLMFGLYFALALTLGLLTTRIRTRERSVRRREERTNALYGYARELSSARTPDEMVHSAVRHISAMLDAKVAVVLAKGDEHGLQAASHEASTFALDEKERSIAEWTFHHRKPAGRFTSTLPAARGYYLPLQTPRGTFGVIGIERAHTLFSVEARMLLESFAAQLASALEREQLSARASESRLMAESERLYATLLNSLSHEFRTPIAVINAAADGLLEAAQNLAPIARQLADEIRRAGRRLNHLVGNLLDMTRLESGRLQLNRQWCNVADVLNAALDRTQTELAAHQVTVNANANASANASVNTSEEDIILAFWDCVLIEQAFVNVLLNAARYTPAGTQVQSSLSAEGDDIIITIADNGPGVSSDALTHLFDKFYRAETTTVGGTGLGLSITKGFVEAHGGTVNVAARPNGGLAFTFRIPRGAAQPEIK
jgi:two-component system sensor histidine kinase KdpD